MTACLRTSTLFKGGPADHSWFSNFFTEEERHQELTLSSKRSNTHTDISFYYFCKNLHPSSSSNAIVLLIETS